MSESLFRAKWLWLWNTLAMFAPLTASKIDDAACDAARRPEVLDEVVAVLRRCNVIR